MGLNFGAILPAGTPGGVFAAPAEQAQQVDALFAGLDMDEDEEQEDLLDQIVDEVAKRKGRRSRFA